MNPATEEILTAYLDGQLDAAQVSALRTRLQNEPELAQLLDQLQVQSTQLSLLPRPKPRPNFAAQVIATAERQNAFGGAKPSAIKIQQRTVSWSIQRWAVLATSLAALLMVGIFVFPQFFEPDEMKVAEFNATASMPDAAKKTEPTAMAPAAEAGQLPSESAAEAAKLSSADQREEFKTKSVGELKSDGPVASSSLRAGMGGGGAGLKNEEHVAPPGDRSVRDDETESEKSVPMDKLASGANAENLPGGGTGGGQGDGVDLGKDPARPMPQPPSQNVDSAIVAASPLESSNPADVERLTGNVKKMGELNLVDSTISQIWVVDLPNDETAANEFRRKLESGLTEKGAKPGTSLPEGQVDVYFVRIDDNSINEELAGYKSMAVVLNVNQDMQPQLSALINRQQQNDITASERFLSDEVDRSKSSDRQLGGFGEGQIEYLGRQADFSLKLQATPEPHSAAGAAVEGRIGQALEIASKDKSVKEGTNIDAIPRIQKNQAEKRDSDFEGLGETNRARKDQAGSEAGEDMPSKDAKELQKGESLGVVVDSKPMGLAQQKPQLSYLILLRRVPQSAPVAPAPTEPVK